ncbi:MAG: polysaccharide deacetylase family protein [Cohaesibacteraceae bacterium]|nr:polysaccharide deacetylase family protein [Cohaesibacteraceae bacterium]
MKRKIQKLVLASVRISRIEYWLKSMMQTRGAILMLHRVREERRHTPFQPNRLLEISPDFLAQVLEFLKTANYDFVSIDDISDRLASSRSRKFIAITLDDGYRDNFEVAKPVFEKFGAPFTVYVASGMIDGTAIPWWIILEEVIRTQDKISFSHNGSKLNLLCESTKNKNHAFIILSRIFNSVSEENQRSLAELFAQAYSFDIKAYQLNEMMNWDQVKELARSGLATIGAHTDSHLSIARVTPEQARRDIQIGMDRIFAKTGVRPAHFAYPYGKSRDAGPEEFSLAKEMGFLTSVTTRAGVLVEDHLDHLQALPRISVNGEFQTLNEFRSIVSGVPFFLANRFSMLDVN